MLGKRARCTGIFVELLSFCTKSEHHSQDGETHLEEAIQICLKSERSFSIVCNQ